MSRGVLLRDAARAGGVSAPGVATGCDDQVALAELQAPDRRSRPAGAGVPRTSNGQAIDHDLDVVPHLAIELQDRRSATHDFAVDASPHESLLQQILEQVAILALLSANQRRQHSINFVPLGKVRIRSMICSRVWAVIGSVALRAVAVPTRANRTRR